jgi:putative inorganic carbon (hco3(-)) transporter
VTIKGNRANSIGIVENRRVSISFLLEWIALGVAFLMPLVFWPASEQPFSAAKEWLLAVWVLTGFALGAAGGLMRRKLPAGAIAAAAIWIIAVSLSAGTGDEASIHEFVWHLLPCAGFLLLLWIGIRPQRLVLALIFSGTIVALVALLQFVRLDPFLLLNLTGSSHGTPRMRIFSTLGNPNFVAALLTVILPLTVFCPQTGIRISPAIWRVFQFGAGLIQAGAIVATGSRAPILSFIAVGIWVLSRKFKFRLRYVFAGLAICAILILFSPARPLEKTISGRLYIWRIIGAHISDIPLAGYGPGAFPLRFAQWETDYIRANPDDSDRVFFGLQDHAHNDYVEIMVDYGIVGLSAFLSVIGLSIPLLYRRDRSLLADAIAASIIALLAVAMVDFPLHRPAELYLFWTQLALLWIVGENILVSNSRLS